ncbi:MAG: matrixin family metalloprotease [bacterium]
MKNNIAVIIRWVFAGLFVTVLAAGCSGTQKAPVTPDNGRDSQLSSTLNDQSALGVSPNIKYLGTAVDPVTGKTVEGYLIRHPKEGDSASLNEIRQAAKVSKPSKVTTCYAFLSAGAKWKIVEDWLVNPSNGDGLASDFILANLTGDIGKWEDAADGITDDGYSINILGNGSLTSTPLIADETAPDGKNEVYFGTLDTNTIAVTIVWGIFLGPASKKELVEWDMIFDDTYNTWSSSGELDKMDFENIATHELGHSCGMSDLYKTSCTEVTMYGYASDGETKKQTLEYDDILGISTLY